MAVVEHKYRPRKYFVPFHARKERFAVLVCHRRSGKTVAVVNDMVVRAMRTKKPDWFGAYVAPYAGQAKRIAWKYLKKAVANLPPGMVKIHEGRTAITFANGAEIAVFGAENDEALRGLYFDLVVLDEMAQIPQSVWTEVIRPALSDRKGSAVFMGTPKGKNYFWRLWRRALGYDQFGKPLPDTATKWFHSKLTVDDTKIIPQTELDSIREDLDEAEFNQEYMVDFDAALVGSYYGRYMKNLIAKKQIRLETLYNPRFQVSASIDIGFNDACAIWFWQIVEGKLNFVEYMEETEKDAKEIMEILKRQPYDYQTIWLPHDAFHRTFVSKKSVFDTFQEYNFPVRRAPNPDAGNRVFHGIDAVRKVLRTYPVQFAEKYCFEGLEALRNYSREWNQKMAQFNDAPKHDRWSHGADSFRYACLSIQIEDIKRSITNDPETIEEQLFTSLNKKPTLDQLTQAHDQRALQQRLARRPRI